LLGDADSIVSWISRELGWTIPAPNQDIRVPGMDDVGGVSVPVPVPPEEVLWISGVGEM
jgi:hypothetical protein